MLSQYTSLQVMQSCMHYMHMCIFYIVHCLVSFGFLPYYVYCIFLFFYFLFPIWIWLQTCEQWVLGWWWRLMKLYMWRRERKIYNEIFIGSFEHILRWKFAAFFSHTDAYRCVLRIKIAKCTKHSSGHMRLVALWH